MWRWIAHSAHLKPISNHSDQKIEPFCIVGAHGGSSHLYKWPTRMNIQRGKEEAKIMDRIVIPRSLKGD